MRGHAMGETSDGFTAEQARAISDALAMVADAHGQVRDAQLAGVAADAGVTFKGVATLRERLVRQGLLEDMAARGMSRVVRQ